MVFPNQQLTVRDPGLGVASPNSDTPVLSGIAFGGSGAVETVLSIADLSQVREVIGYGPLAEDVALALQQRGGPVLVVIHDVTPTPVSPTPMTGSGTQITIAGTPRDYYNVRVEITTSGYAGAARFRYSLDAFDANAAPFTWSAVRFVPLSGSFVIPNSGLTLGFSTEEEINNYVAGDAYTYSAIPESPGAVDLAAVASVLSTTPSLVFGLWLLSGAQEDEIDGAAIAAAFGGHLTTLTQSFRYVRGLVDIGSGAAAADVLDESEGWTSARISPAYGFTLRSSALPFEGYATRKCSCVSGLGVRAMRELISTDLARTASGPDEGVRKIEFDGFYDQRLDEAKVSTMRTWPGIAGFYFAGGKLKSPFGSDFTDLQFGRVMDVACRTTYVGQFPFTAGSFRTIETGAIDPRDAGNIEQAVSGALGSALTSPANAEGTPGHVSAFRYTVDLLHNLVTTGQLKTSVGIRPLGYPKEFLTDLFFTLTP